MGRLLFNFFKMERQSMEKMSQPTSLIARCSIRQRKGLRMNKGSYTFFCAILWTKLLRYRKGESKTRALTSYEYISANMIAHMLPILLPQSTILPTLICFLIYCSMSRISKTQLTPQLKNQGSLLPHPKRSKAARLNPNDGMSQTKGKASNLLPPLPCKYRMVSLAQISGEQKRQPDIFLPLRLITVRSILTIFMDQMTRCFGPKEVILDFIWVGFTMLFQPSSKIFIMSYVLNYQILL